MLELLFGLMLILIVGVVLISIIGEKYEIVNDQYSVIILNQLREKWRCIKWQLETIANYLGIDVNTFNKSFCLPLEYG